MCQWKIPKVGKKSETSKVRTFVASLLVRSVWVRGRAWCRPPTPSRDLGDVTCTSEGARYTDAWSLRPATHVDVCMPRRVTTDKNWWRRPSGLTGDPVRSARCLTTSGRIIGFHAYNSALDLWLQINWPSGAPGERRHPPWVLIRNQMTY